MSDQQPQPGTMVPPVALDMVLGQLVDAVGIMAAKAKGVGDVREVKEYGAAALNFAQAYAILHPDMVAPQGVRPEVLAKATPQQGPKKKTLTRDERGRVNGISEE